MNIYINKITYNNSISNGPGLRTVLFMQGCDIRCKGCHNKSTWDIKKGIKIDVDTLVKVINKNCINHKITISGGEPLLQQEALLYLLKKLHDNNYDIVLYTGHEEGDIPKEIVKYIKYIKTGKFIESLKVTTKFYGSSNQSFRKIEE